MCGFSDVIGSVLTEKEEATVYESQRGKIDTRSSFVFFGTITSVHAYARASFSYFALLETKRNSRLISQTERLFVTRRKLLDLSMKRKVVMSKKFITQSHTPLVCSRAREVSFQHCLSVCVLRKNHQLHYQFAVHCGREYIS